ncbi:AI-2E family transporter [Aeromicrobium sp. CF3.5]|uniref:AI-2E family transporter n=1 Tax=Aeromicrobium sp. CF3.5 TaxID=3373078 RepID=UPI003EE541B1
MNEERVRDRAVVIDDAVGGMQRWALRIVIIGAALFLAGWVIGQLWVIVFPAAIALVITSLLQPLASWLRGKGWPSALAAAVVMLGFIAAVVGIVVALTPQVAGQSSAIAQGASDGLQQVRDWVTGGPLNLSEGQITQAISAVQDRLQDSAAAISAGVFSTISAATSVIINFVVILLLTFYFVKDGHKFGPWARTLGGKRAGEHVGAVMGRSWGTLGGFIRTQTLVSFIDAVIIGAGLIILDVELAIPLAVLTFFGGYIPIVGAVISGLVAVLVTLVTNSPQDALIALIIVIAVQQLEGNVLSPLLQGKSLNLHPAVVLLGVTAGGTLFGITGAFLAVPVVATAAEVLRYINEQIDHAVGPGAPLEDSRAVSLLADDTITAETSPPTRPAESSD